MGPAFLRKYNTATAGGTHIRVPMIDAGASDFAASGDWTPVAGDVKLSKDGGAQANIGTLPTYTNGAWQFQLTDAELSCKQLEIMVVDSATKAVEDQCILVETFGNASAMYLLDFGEAMRGTDSAYTGTPPTASAIADAVLDEAKGAHSGHIAAIPTTAMRGTDSAYTGTPPTADAIADAVLDEAKGAHSGHIAAIPTTAMRGTDSAYTGTPPTAGAIADAVLDEAKGAHSGHIAAIPTTAMRGTDGAYTGTPPTVSAIADGMWDELQSGHIIAGSFGLYLDTAISSLKTVTDKLDTTLELDGAVYRFTENALEEAPSGSGTWTAAEKAIALKLLQGGYRR